MFNAAMHAEMLHDHADYGFDVRAQGFDWKKLKTARDAYVARLNGIYARNLEGSNVTVFSGEARFAEDQPSDGRAVLLNDPEDTRLVAKNVLLAVGGRPSQLRIEGAELCIDSDGFFELEERPKWVPLVEYIYHPRSWLTLWLKGISSW